MYISEKEILCSLSTSFCQCQLNCYGLAMEFSIVVPVLTVQIHFKSMRKGEYRNDLVVDDAGLRVGCFFFFLAF